MANRVVDRSCPEPRRRNPLGEACRLRFRRYRPLLAASLLLMTWFSAPAGAQKTAEPEDLSSSEPDLEKHGLSLSSAVDYSVGRYGSHVTTQILVFPQEVDW